MLDQVDFDTEGITAAEYAELLRILFSGESR
jgi:hypothetical protein